MLTSWAHHKTIVEQRARIAVEELFGSSADRWSLEGNEPRLFSDPARLSFVETGAVDLFLVDIDAGNPTGRRWHFVRVEAGELLPEMPILLGRGEQRGAGLVAVGISGTRIASMPRDKLRALARGVGANESLHGLLDIWTRRVAERVPSRDLPGEARPLATEGQVTAKEGEVLTAGPKTRWVRLLSGSAEYCDLLSIRAPRSPRFFPLTRASWIRAKGATEIELVEPEALFAAETDWSSLDYFHRMVLHCLVVARAERTQRETRKVLARMEDEDRRFHHVIERLSSREEATGAPEADRTQLQLAACRRIGAWMGVAVSAPPEGFGTDLASILRVNHLRGREVVLEDEWWRQSGEPLIGSYGDDDRPVALIPRPSGGYLIHETTSGREGPLGPDLAAGLHPRALAIYRPFPRRALKPLDVLRFGLRGTSRDLITLGATGLLLGVFPLVTAFALGEIVDHLIPNAEVNLVLQMGLGLVVVAVATLLTTVARGTASLRLETRISSSVQSAVWDRLMALPVSFFRQFSVGDLALRAGGIDEARRSLSGSALNTALSGFFSLISFGLLLYYDVELALVAGALALVGVAYAFGVGLVSVRLARRLEETEGQLSSEVLEYIDGITKIRIAGAEKRVFNRWSRRFSEKRKTYHRIQVLQNRFDVLGELLPVLTTAVLFFLVAREGSSVSTGQFIGFFVAFGMFSGGLNDLVGVALEQIALLPLWERSGPILATAPEVHELEEHPGELQGEIHVSQLSFRYAEGGSLILDGVDFTVNRGEFVAIVGGSGAGKSTLLRLLLGFEKPNAGAIFYDGKDLSALDIVEVRRQFGVVLQNGELMAGDLFTNIIGTRNLSHDDAWEAARMAGLDQEIREMPMQMHTVVSHGGRSLSGGQQQRVLIARALVSRPRILFFDEATSALDENTQAVVAESLEGLNATRVVIAHRLSTIRNADRIIVLERGRVAQMGRYEELIELEGPFAELARRQIA